MIDLSRNRAEFLAEIQAPRAGSKSLGDITDPRVTRADGHVCVHGKGWRDLFPMLKAALLERFSSVPRPELIQDLLVPLKNALGNAFKHGNGRNPAKTISVELELTGKGVLIAITDQGQGFDAALTFGRFQNKESYATNHGHGLLNLHRARSAVTYENNGRTVLLRFQPTMDGDSGPCIPLPVAEPSGGSGPHSARRGAVEHIRGWSVERPVTPALNPRWVKAHLPTAVPEFSHTRIEACRVYPPRGRAADDCGIRYVLQVASSDGEPASTRILTGRLHTTAVPAANDFQSAIRLHTAGITARLLFPRPVAWLAGELRLVLYDFDPWLNLREYLVHRGNLKSVRHAAERAGEALAVLHRSRALGRGPEKVDAPGSRFEAGIERAEQQLQKLGDASELLDRFRSCAQAVRKQILFRRPRAPSPIHGALDWDCIQYGIDGRFYLYRLESCKWSDPGLDLGGFAGELIRFTRAHHDEGGYLVCRDALLDAYNRESEEPMSAEDLRFYIAFSVIDRLQHAPAGAATEAGEWLNVLETDIRGWQTTREIEVSA